MIAAVAALATGLMVAGSAAQSATPGKRYLRFSATGVFTYQVDHGEDSYAVFNRTFTWQAMVHVRGIAVYAGRAVAIPPGAMIVESSVSVANEVTVWTPGGARVPARCDNPQRSSNGLRPTRGGYITISNTSLYVNPGSAVVSGPACNAIESMVHHGLPSGPTLNLPPPARSRFNGRGAFSIGCHEQFEHDWHWNGDQKHKFRGSAHITATFTPFPRSALEATKRNLRAQIGQAKGSVNPRSGNWRPDCL